MNYLLKLVLAFFLGSILNTTYAQTKTLKWHERGEPTLTIDEHTAPNSTSMQLKLDYLFSANEIQKGEPVKLRINYSTNYCYPSSYSGIPALGNRIDGPTEISIDPKHRNNFDVATTSFTIKGLPFQNSKDRIYCYEDDEMIRIDIFENNGHYYEECAFVKSTTSGHLSTVPTNFKINRNADNLHFSWKAPISVDKFQLQVQKKGGQWDNLLHDQIIERNEITNSNEIIALRNFLFEHIDTFTKYNSSENYEARLKTHYEGKWQTAYTPSITFTPQNLPLALTLQANNKTIKAGNFLTGKVVIPNEHISKSPITVTLNVLSNKGLSYLKSSPIEVVIPPNENEVDYELPIKHVVGSANAKLHQATLVAEVNNFRSAKLSISILPNVLELRNEQLTMPPLPELKIQNGTVVCIKEKKIVRSSKEITGFWIACRLQPQYEGSQTNTSTSHFKDTTNPNPSDKIVPLWIPLKNFPKRYYATAEYRNGSTYSLGYDEIENKTYSTETSYSIHASSSDSKGGIQKTHILHNRHEDVSLKSTLEATVGFPPLGSGKISIESDIKKGWSKVSGIDVEKSGTFVLGNTNTETRQFKTSTTVSKKGPTTSHFRRVYQLFYPTISYYFGELDNFENSDESVEIGSYIDYEVDSPNDTKSIEDYVQYLFQPEQFYTSKNTQSRLKTYMHKYKKQLRMNSELESFIADIKNHQSKMIDITIGNYSVGIFEGEINYGDPNHPIEVSIDQPIDCTPVEANIEHHFKLVSNEAKSHFKWELPPSATESEIQIQSAKNPADIKSASMARARNANGQPLKQNFELPATTYSPNNVYLARVRSKCGAQSSWSAYSDPLTLTFAPEQCRVTGLTATIEPSSTGASPTYKIKWDNLKMAKHYYVEYTTSTNNLIQERFNTTTAYGTDIHVFDRPIHVNTYTYVGDAYLSAVYVRAACATGVSAPTILTFAPPVTDCKPNSSSLQIKGTKFGGKNPEFQWHAGQGVLFFKIEIQKMIDNEWVDFKTHLDIPIKEGDFWASITQAFTDINQSYNPGSYRARLFSRCNAKDASDWISATPWKNFEIDAFKPELTIYPNPIGDKLRFKLSNTTSPLKNIKIDIFNLDEGAREVHNEIRHSIQADEIISIDKDFIPLKTYLLKIELADGLKLDQRFQKK